MSEMLERCARAVEAAEYRAWATLPPEVHIDARRRMIARAVIEALMEPTPEMVEHAYRGPIVSYKAMLRAALGDEDGR